MKKNYILFSIISSCYSRLISDYKNIKKGDELSYDYGYVFDVDDYQDHICKCGSSNCIDYIISQDDWEKYKKHLLKKIKKLK